MTPIYRFLFTRIPSTAENQGFWLDTETSNQQLHQLQPQTYFWLLLNVERTWEYSVSLLQHLHNLQ